MPGDNLGQVTGKFLGGKGIERTAYAFYFFLDLSGGIFPGALETKMLQQMGNALIGPILIPSAGAYPNPQGRGISLRHFISNQP